MSLSGEVKTPPFSAAARVEAGFLLRTLQAGELLGMPQLRPMPSIGPGCHELRIPDAGLTGASSIGWTTTPSLSARLRKARGSGNLTQTDLAKRMGSSQSRVAKMEAGDPTVSLDLLVQGLLAAGATRRQIASALGQRKKAVGE